MVNASVFDFSGSVERIQIRVQLFQSGVPPLDFEKFNQADVDYDDSGPRKTKVDEILIGWNQKIGNFANGHGRLFTLREADEIPDELKNIVRFEPDIEEMEEKTTKKSEENERPSNNDSIVFRKSKAKIFRRKSERMQVFANVGATENFFDARSIQLVAKISISDSNRLKIEPAIDPMFGIKVESNFGDYVAKIQIQDCGFENGDDVLGPKTKGGRLSITSLTESENFQVASDGMIESTIIFSLLDGKNFLFNDGLTIDYKLKLPAKVALKFGKQSGRTQRFAASNSYVNFSQILEFGFEYSHQAIQPQPLLMIRMICIDYWGRQYVAGYGSTFISLSPGRSTGTINLWRPISKNPIDNLYEQFVGQAIDIDYFGINETDQNQRVGANGETSGQIRFENRCICQSRRFMARDVLYQLKYGSKMADMGLRSDFYQRIIKVLMDFEEARAKLLSARAINKKKEAS